MTYRYVTDRALRFAQIVLLFEAVVRGLNYLATPAGVTPAYSQLELSAPLSVWGTLFIVLGVGGLFGEALMSGTTAPPGHEYNPRAWPSFLAHSGLMVLFLAIALSAIVGVAQREPFYGFVAAYDCLTFAVGHYVFARRRKNAT